LFKYFIFIKIFKQIIKIYPKYHRNIYRKYDDKYYKMLIK